VQFSDLAEPVPPSAYKKVARHERLLPGFGNWPLSNIVRILKSGGYEGPVDLEVFNDQLQSQDTKSVAQEAFKALTDLSNAG
jgi:4-hydroxyphenylpyruvate dioxygenase